MLLLAIFYSHHKLDITQVLSEALGREGGGGGVKRDIAIYELCGIVLRYPMLSHCQKAEYE